MFISSLNCAVPYPVFKRTDKWAWRLLFLGFWLICFSFSASAQDKLEFPPAVAALLLSAGLADATPYDLSSLPENRRPADYAWRYHDVFGGIRERQITSDKDFKTLVAEYNANYKQRCGGAFQIDLKPVQSFGELQMQQVWIDCRKDETHIQAALLYYLTPTRIFTLVSHEGGARELATTRLATQQIAEVIARIASNPELEDRPKKP